MKKESGRARKYAESTKTCCRSGATRGRRRRTIYATLNTHTAPQRHGRTSRDPDGGGGTGGEGPGGDCRQEGFLTHTD